MAEVKKKQNKKTSNTSKVQNVSRKKNVVSELSSDELMEQILAKKKNKKNDTSSIKKKTSSSIKQSKSISTKKKEENLTLSNDELYDLIKSKKKKTIKAQNVSSSKKEKDISASDSSDNSLKEEVLISEEINIDEKTQHKEDIRDDLIITREINFTDDKVDLNDKKVLEQLREAIEEFDSLDKTSPKLDEKDDFSFDIPDTRCVDKKSFFKKINTKYLIILSLVFIIIFCIIIFVFKGNGNENNTIIKFPSLNKEEVIDVRIAKYEECLKRPFSESDNTGDILLAQEEFTNYLKNNYKTSVMYEDLSLGFSYSFNPNLVYYGASTIKALDALYIYTKAASGEINLDDTMTYSSKYKWGSSREMNKYDYGQKVTLRNLVKYAVTVSDNSAHQMLVSYIGKNKLQEYGKSLGAKFTLEGSDNFGNISVEDAIIYMKEINDFINSNGELGEELKSYFVQADQNSLEFTDLGIKAAHKYGEYSYYYHDIGIVYADKPYVVAILTYEGKSDFLSIVKDINSHIYQLHQLYYSNRENICQLEVYGN